MGRQAQKLESSGFLMSPSWARCCLKKMARSRPLSVQSLLQCKGPSLPLAAESACGSASAPLMAPTQHAGARHQTKPGQSLHRAIELGTTNVQQSCHASKINGTLQVLVGVFAIVTCILMTTAGLGKPPATHRPYMPSPLADLNLKSSSLCTT